MALSSNSNAGSTETKVGAGALSNFNTENKSNGNFSGGDVNFDTSKLSTNNPFDTKESQQPTFNTDDVFKPTLSGNLDIDLPKTNNNSINSNNTTYSNNSKEPTMTVDEVYGKSNNQPLVEKQGDYSASSNEKSNVETSTFGKQDEVAVTPLSVTEDKGMVGNAAIQSVEGLDFQQKDKASVDVLDSKKKRDEAESKDKANSMRDKLKANVSNAKQEEGAVNQLQIGEENTFEKQNNAKLNELNQQKQELENKTKDADRALENLNKAKEEQTKTKDEATRAYKVAEEAGEALSDLVDGVNSLLDNPISVLLNKSEINVLKGKITEDAKKYGVDINPRDNLKEALAKYYPAVKAKVEEDMKNAEKRIQIADDKVKEAEKALEDAKVVQQEVQAKYDKAQEDYKTWEAEYWVNDTKTKAEEVANVKTNAEVSFEAIKESINNAELPEETKSNAIEMISSVEASAKAVNEAADALAANPNDPATIETYVNAVKTYNEKTKSALKGNPLAKTDLNKTFTEMVAKANDFDVTLPDGTKASYAEFAAKMAIKSPALAKGLYEAKAKNYEENGHKVLAAIERAKAEMVTTWLGSKFTFADNQVRNQFNQMAKTDMRATYATYNNVLNDPNATPEQKAEASKSINQANALMTASAALQASTGFLPGIGDSMSDGVYGTTDPKTRNAWQKTLNAIDNFAKITLGLGVTPGANKAYQNMYYMAGAKVNESGLFGRDFDSDGFALCQEYGNNAAAGMIAGAGELATGVALFFNPATVGMGLNLVVDSVQIFTDGLYGVQIDARKSQQYTQEVLSYFKEAESIAAETGNKEVMNAMSATMSNAVKQIENFELKADEVGNLDNWLEGSGSNTASNEKFNQSLTYDEWLKLIEADPTMRGYAKKLIAEKKDKNAQKDNADARVDS